MELEKAFAQYKRYFRDKIAVHGPVPQGVDYNGPEAQVLRFEQLIKVIEPAPRFEIIDFGCGYGGLLTFLQAKGWDFMYHGYDMLEQMVGVARVTHAGAPNADFTTSAAELRPCDYVLAGAIFNNKFDAPADAWREYSMHVLRQMSQLCTKGLAFNMLSRYSDADRVAARPDLYFADPLFYFDYCKTALAPDVALLHDYGLHDFTILVRKHG